MSTETDIQSTRKTRLIELAAGCDGQVGLAKALGKTPGYINQLARGHRPITEKTARGIEKRLSLPVGWMDTPIKACVEDVKAEYGHSVIDLDAARIALLMKGLGPKSKALILDAASAMAKGLSGAESE